MAYTAVVKRKSSDELTHWKYIKREKVGDKWKYYYDADQLKTDVKNATGIGLKKDMANYKNQAAYETSQANKAAQKEAANRAVAIKTNDTANSHARTAKVWKDAQTNKEQKAWDSTKERNEALNAYDSHRERGRLNDMSEGTKNLIKDANRSYKQDTKARDFGREVINTHESKAADARNAAKAARDNADLWKAQMEKKQAAAKDALSKYDTTKSIYDKSLAGKVEKAGQWLGNLFKMDKDEIATNIKNAIGIGLKDDMERYKSAAETAAKNARKDAQGMEFSKEQAAKYRESADKHSETANKWREAQVAKDKKVAVANTNLRTAKKMYKDRIENEKTSGKEQNNIQIPFNSDKRASSTVMTESPAYKALKNTKVSSNSTNSDNKTKRLDGITDGEKKFITDANKAHKEAKKAQDFGKKVINAHDKAATLDRLSSYAAETDVEIFRNQMKEQQAKVHKNTAKYMSTKSIYDKSLIGRVDKATDWLEELFKKR